MSAVSSAILIVGVIVVVAGLVVSVVFALVLIVPDDLSGIIRVIRTSSRTPFNSWQTVGCVVSLDTAVSKGLPLGKLISPWLISCVIVAAHIMVFHNLPRLPGGLES